MSDDTTAEKNTEDTQAAAEPEINAEAAETVPPKSLEDQLAEAQARATEYLDGWQRARAELDNYRKRMTRERSEWNETLRVEAVLAVLPALDDFDLALANLPEDIAGHAWVNGVILAHRKLVSQLQSMGVEEMQIGAASFDPALHEAVTHEESKDHQPGDIIGVVRKGYKMGDKVIRPALVRVAS